MVDHHQPRIICALKQALQLDILDPKQVSFSQPRNVYFNIDRKASLDPVTHITGYSCCTTHPIDLYGESQLEVSLMLIAFTFCA